MKSVIGFLALFFWGLVSRAEAVDFTPKHPPSSQASGSNMWMYADLSGYNDSDSFSTSSTASYSKIFYSLDVLFSLDKGTRLYGGVHGHQLSLSEKPATLTTTLNSTDLGALLVMFLNDRKNFFISGGYNLSVSGQFTNGVTNSDLAGTSYQAALGCILELTKDISLGLKWNYYNVNYTKSTTSGVSADVAYSRTITFPAISLVWHN